MDTFSRKNKVSRKSIYQPYLIINSSRGGNHLSSVQYGLFYFPLLTRKRFELNSIEDDSTDKFLTVSLMGLQILSLWYHKGIIFKTFVSLTSEITLSGFFIPKMKNVNFPYKVYFNSVGNSKEPISEIINSWCTHPVSYQKNSF